MKSLMQTLTTAVFGLGMLFATGCSSAVVPLQPTAGILQNYPTRSPLVKTMSLATQSGTRTAN
ncbi:MAG: hypothetical protein H7338_24010, partial [Candidatus Sericytochromatia bacterium]|nr:hypothetical protein [Candidatus Sericytochromatia bacterium]